MAGSAFVPMLFTKLKSAISNLAFYTPKSNSANRAIPLDFTLKHPCLLLGRSAPLKQDDAYLR